jgi:hypothetical protein
MGKMKDLYTDGVTDLKSYYLGMEAERERIVAILKHELRDTYKPINGTIGGWRRYLLGKIGLSKHE